MNEPRLIDANQLLESKYTICSPDNNGTVPVPTWDVVDVTDINNADTVVDTPIAIFNQIRTDICNLYKGELQPNNSNAYHNPALLDVLSIMDDHLKKVKKVDVTSPVVSSGYWIVYESDDQWNPQDRIICPFCQHEPRHMSNHCPNCGAILTAPPKKI